MLALRLNKIQISPDFLYNSKEIPEETLRYAAKLWYMVEELVGLTPVDYTATFGVWVKYHEDLPAAIQKVRQERPLGRDEDVQHLKPALLRDIFKHHIGRVRSTVWGSDLRQRLVPSGSDRERSVVNFYRGTVGRLIGE